MDVVSQPTEHDTEITTANMLFGRPNRRRHCLAQLRAHQVPKQIGGEITKQTFAPVHILEAALRIICRGDPQQFAITTVPFAREILHRQTLFQQSQLKIGSHKDVKSVAEFIRFHPVATGSHWIHRLPQIRRRSQRCTRSGKAFPPEFCKGLTAGYPVFPEQRLTFMHGHRRGLTERPGEPLMRRGRQSLLVQRMAPLMGCGQKTGQRLTSHHTRGDAEVARTQCD